MPRIRFPALQALLLLVSAAPALAQPDGPDVFLGELDEFFQLGRVGDTIGCGIDSHLCNAGNEPMAWFGNPDPRHPFMTFNLYRLSPAGPGGATRFEQIGQSWLKHAFAAAQESMCGLTCIPDGGTHLGVGCSDTYGAELNGFQGLLGPRSELNPWTGDFVYEGSHLDTPQPPHTAISHRLQIRDADLDPAANPGAVYICEVYILHTDDVDHMNSLAHERLSVSGTPGGMWNLSIVPLNSTVIGPALDAWDGATQSVIPDVLAGDGRCILSVRVTGPSAGRWHYEYALYNHDMDRGVDSFSLPVGSAAITGAAFHAVRSHDEPEVDNDAWTMSISGGRITWSTERAGVPTTSNPLRWGTMYSFRFDADRPPVSSSAIITPHKAGGPASFTGPTQAPAAPCAADFNIDGAHNSQDFFDYLTAFFGGMGIADINGDGVVNSQDSFDFLAAFFVGCV